MNRINIKPNIDDYSRKYFIDHAGIDFKTGQYVDDQLSPRQSIAVKPVSPMVESERLAQIMALSGSVPKGMIHDAILDPSMTAGKLALKWLRGGR